MELSALVPMAFVRNVPSSVEFYGKLGFTVGNTHTPFRSMVIQAGVDAGPIQYPFYAPKGEFRVTDPDGYVLMVTHT